MPVVLYNETSDTSNNLLETGELVFGNTPWNLTGSMSPQPPLTPQPTNPFTPPTLLHERPRLSTPLASGWLLA